MERLYQLSIYIYILYTAEREILPHRASLYCTTGIRIDILPYKQTDGSRSEIDREVTLM